MYTQSQYENSLCHYGIKGQTWGERRYQNLDGTYTALGERRRLETLARTGNTVTSSSSAKSREQAARTGTAVKITSNNISKSPSRPISRPTNTTSGTSTVSVNKKATTSKKPETVITGNSRPVLSKPSNSSGYSAKVNYKESEDTTKKKTKTKVSSTSDDEEEETTAKKSSTKKKSSKKKKQQKSQKEQEQQQTQNENESESEENKDQTVPEGKLTDEQVREYAQKVIRGDFGNGQKRKDLLGENYAQIQALVNAILKRK